MVFFLKIKVKIRIVKNLLIFLYYIKKYVIYTIVKYKKILGLLLLVNINNYCFNVSKALRDIILLPCSIGQYCFSSTYRHNFNQSCIEK